jgi:hypothetical protein
MDSKEKIEEWRDIHGYEGKYQVSNFGNVRTLTRIINEHRRSYTRRGKVLNKYYNKDGYYKVKLYNGDSSFANLSVHRLVANVFIDNPNNYAEVNHIDGDPSNNHIDNIEWCSKEQNVKHAYATGLKRRENYVGEANKCSKLKEKDIVAMREEYATGTTSYNKLARKHNVVMGNVWSIVNRKTWSHV